MHILKLDLGGGWSILNYFSVCIEFMKLSVTDEALLYNVLCKLKLQESLYFLLFVTNNLFMVVVTCLEYFAG